MEILFYDGSCGLCNHSVRTLFKWDKKNTYFYSPLQSDFALKLGIVNPGEDLSTVILVQLTDIDKFRVYKRSDAVIEIAAGLGGFFKIALIGKIIPRLIRDFMYMLVANNRHRFNFGNHVLCTIPEPKLVKRIINTYEDFIKIAID